MIERLVGFPLGVHLVHIGGKAAIGDRPGIDHGHHAIDRHTLADFRPVECADQRLRQRQPGCLDDDMIGFAVALEQGCHGRHEVVRHRAADAAIGEFDDIVYRTGLLAATFQHLAIDTEIAKLVDDERNAFAVRRLQKIADQSRFTGTEKAGDHGCRYFLTVGSGHRFVLCRPMPAV